MALQLGIETDFGLSATDAYHRIGNIRVRRTTNSSEVGISCLIDIYANKEARDNNKQPLKHINFSFITGDLVNFYEQAYEKLKISVVENIDYSNSLDI